jgi:hypothetical protein
MYQHDEGSQGSSVSIPMGYGLNGRGSISDKGNFSLLHSAQTGSGVHPVSSPMGIRGSFHGGKAAGASS